MTEHEQAALDHKRYVAALMQPDGWRACLAIEQKWFLDGYPPAIVSSVLVGVSDGLTLEQAEAEALGQGGDE